MHINECSVLQVCFFMELPRRYCTVIKIESCIITSFRKLKCRESLPSKQGSDWCPDVLFTVNGTSNPTPLLSHNTYKQSPQIKNKQQASNLPSVVKHAINMRSNCEIKVRLKVYFTPKIFILSLFTHSYLVPNL